MKIINYKILLLCSLFLTSCNPPIEGVTRTECNSEIQDARRNQQEETMAHIKNLDNPSVFYGSVVRIKEGFYEGQTGMVVSQDRFESDNDYRTITIKLRHHIYDNNGNLIRFLQVYRSDLGEVK